MAHIVVMVGDYYPLPSANGICIETIIDELIRRGHEVDVICNGKCEQYGYAEHNKVLIHTIKGILPKTVAGKVARKILSYPRLVYWPVNYPWKLKQFFRMFKIIHERTPVDCLISVQKPAEASAAGKMIKRYYPEIRNCLYVLDSIANDLDTQHGIGVLLKSKSEKAEQSYHESYDFIFHMDFNKEFYSQYEALAEYSNKISYLALPLISRKMNERFVSLEREKNSTEPIRFVYSGMLGVGFRDPSLLIRLIVELRSQMNRAVDCKFFSKISLDRFHCREYEENQDIISSNPYIPQSELDEILANADFLLSIGNPYSETVKQVPSKIFMYMSTCKPIIHVLGGKDDICIEYLERYDNCLLIDPKESFKENSKKFRSFIELYQENKACIDTVLNSFQENTPEWSADCILKTVGI